MPLSSGAYVSALRWRQAEYQALLRLSESVKDRIVPLITIPPIEFDFEKEKLSKSVHEHVQHFPERFFQKWDARPAWVALDETIESGCMEDGKHVGDYVFDGLRNFGAISIPALRLSAHPSMTAAVARAVAFDGHGIAVITQLEDLTRSDTRARVLGLVHEADFNIDLGRPNYEPYISFAIPLVRTLRNFGNLDSFRNLVLIGTAIPESMKLIARGSDEIPRHDWLFYRVLLSKLPPGLRRPAYGDHTIVHPGFTATMDMRMVRPAGKVLYTMSKAWGTRKGGAFVADRLQMHNHCSIIVTDPKFEFRGKGFSYGDEYIAGCAVRENGTGNQTRWKEVGINHHITTVVDDLAKLNAETSTA
ncbi:MAG: beta family protein [Alphaproteobacteria bacterium]|nr:beta family protein [Alphaproteobacteria bacterium]